MQLKPISHIFYEDYILALRKVANHAVLCDITPMGQIHLPGDIIRHHDSGFKLTISDEGPAVHADLHSIHRLLQRCDHANIPVADFNF